MGSLGVAGLRFNVRRLGPDDTLPYREVRLEALLQSPEMFNEVFEQELAQSDAFFTAELGSGERHFTVGCFKGESELIAIASFRDDLMKLLYVQPEYRSRRVGSVLLAEIVETVQFYDGLTGIRAQVPGPSDSPARGLFLKAGFVADPDDALGAMMQLTWPTDP